MKYAQDVREVLIANTIRLISEGGFEKATTKAIVHSGEAIEAVKMNEVYIYRLFGSKEKLYEVAFESLDNELVKALSACVRSVGSFENCKKDTLYEVFIRTWRFLLKNEARCRCYVRYYYSVYFRGNSLACHRKLFSDIVEAFDPLFKEEADVEAIMHSVLTTMLDFAIRVYNGDLKDDDINTPHIFNVVFCMMMTYFKDEVLEGMKTA